MHIVGFTSARNIFGVAARRFTEVLDYLEDAGEFVTGGARGGDAAIGAYLAHRYPYKSHTVLLPTNKNQISDWWTLSKAAVKVIEMPEGTDYKYRNQAIVDRSTELIGFPEFDEFDPRSKRSGTWQTIRMARRVPIMNTVFVLREET